MSKFGEREWSAHRGGNSVGAPKVHQLSLRSFSARAHLHLFLEHLLCSRRLALLAANQLTKLFASGCPVSTLAYSQGKTKVRPDKLLKGFHTEGRKQIQECHRAVTWINSTYLWFEIHLVLLVIVEKILIRYFWPLRLFWPLNFHFIFWYFEESRSSSFSYALTIEHWVAQRWF